MSFSFCSNNCDANEVSDGFQSLCDGFSNVLNDIFNCDRFAIELLTNFHGNHIRVCLKIMKLLLQSSTVDNPRYLNYADFNIEQKNIIHHMFNVCIPKGDYSFQWKNVFLFTYKFFLIHPPPPPPKKNNTHTRRDAPIVYIAQFTH